MFVHFIELGCIEYLYLCASEIRGAQILFMKRNTSSYLDTNPFMRPFKPSFDKFSSMLQLKHRI